MKLWVRLPAAGRCLQGLRFGVFGAVVWVLVAGGDLRALADERRVGADARGDLALTVYDSGLALISETRRIDLPAGETHLVLDDVSAALRPETLLLGGPGLTVLEQSLASDVITPRRLLATQIGRAVEVVSRHPQSGEERFEQAELLAVAEQAVVRRDGRVEMLPYDRIAVRDVPAHLRLRPTLLATLARAEAGETDLQLQYLSGGLSWHTDYVAELERGGEALRLTALVTLVNQSGSAFGDATLRLVAGEVNQVAPPPLFKARQPEAMAVAAAAPAVPEPQSLGERYLYKVPRPIDLAAGETKQVLLFSTDGVSARQLFRVNDRPDFRQGPPRPVNADLVLNLLNNSENGLGRPLPGGTLRVYETSEDGARIFSGEDRVSHTPIDGLVELRLGAAFDVTAEARQIDYQRLDKTSGSYETARGVTVKNAKPQAVEVEVVAWLPHGWRMLDESHAHEALDAQRVRWRIPVPAAGQSELVYRVQVTP